jgi:dolichol-phosphate mannosyltransferase
MDPELSVVVPFHNEGGNVVPLVQQIFSAFQNERRCIELVLVDDGSADDTWARIQELCRTDPRVRALCHSERSGQSAALWTGFKASRGDVILTLDGDLQNDPADLPRLLGELADCDLVCGVRLKRMDNSLRRLSSKVAHLARKLVLNADFRDTGCNLRAFKRSVLEVIPAFNGFHRFMPILARGGGATVKELPVAHHPRAAGQSNYGVWNRLGRGVYDLVMVRWYLKRQIKRIPVFEYSSGESPGQSARLDSNPDPSRLADKSRRPG